MEGTGETAGAVPLKVPRSWEAHATRDKTVIINNTLFIETPDWLEVGIVLSDKRLTMQFHLTKGTIQSSLILANFGSGLMTSPRHRWLGIGLNVSEITHLKVGSGTLRIDKLLTQLRIARKHIYHSIVFLARGMSMCS